MRIEKRTNLKYIVYFQIISLSYISLKAYIIHKHKEKKEYYESMSI